MGMAIVIVAVSVGTTVICEVASGGLDSFMEPAALDVVPGVVRAVPTATILCEAGGEGS